MYKQLPAFVISIHAPREGSDVTMSLSGLLFSDFYPRSPRGERRLRRSEPAHQAQISIHAPREGSDL